MWNANAAKWRRSKKQGSRDRSQTINELWTFEHATRSSFKQCDQSNAQKSKWRSHSKRWSGGGSSSRVTTWQIENRRRFTKPQYSAAGVVGEKKKWRDAWRFESHNDHNSNENGGAPNVFAYKSRPLGTDDAVYDARGNRRYSLDGRSVTTWITANGDERRRRRAGKWWYKARGSRPRCAFENEHTAANKDGFGTATRASSEGESHRSAEQQTSN